MKNEPVNLDRFIKLITKNELDKKDIGAWYRCVVNHAPSGIIRSFSIVNKKGKPKSVALVHRVNDNDLHSYLVPLTRDLSEVETETIVKEFAEIRPNLDFDIETHATTLHAMQYGTISLDAAKHLALCTAMEKQKHQDWMRERTDAGWRYGTKFDADEKTHPLLLSWDQLPDRYRSPDMDWPQKLVDMLNDQGYAVIDKQELHRLVTMLRNVI